MSRSRPSLGTLLKHVHRSGPMSRAALARRMGVNRSTIMDLTRELAAAGLLEHQHAAAGSGAGRPSLVVRPRPERAYVLAFDIETDRLAAARVGLGGQLLDRREADTPTRASGRDMCDVLAELGQQIQQSATPGSACVGAGAALGAEPTTIGTDLRHLLGRPVAVGRRAQLAAFAERERGAGAGFRDVAYLQGGDRVDGGIVVDGAILGRHDGQTPAIGHMLVDPQHGLPCSCGSLGCLDTKLGRDALLAGAGRDPEASHRDAVDAMVRDAAAGDHTAAKALAIAGDWLGIAVANLITLMRPQVVILDGTLRYLYAGAAEQVHARIAHHTTPDTRRPTHLRPGILGQDAALLGAAELGFAAFLDDPLHITAASAAYPGPPHQ
ncbi:ROK family transcriptional regulator [Dactylosporangium sp. NPDC000555]|uniref:ROK family transcriptional regulator n=1 Tax=Dactylosporangium sp. NPDC000555 TaxID=3154260 RepID=UPI003329DFDD